MWNLKKQKNQKTHRYREKIGGCQRQKLIISPEKKKKNNSGGGNSDIEI